MTNIQEILEKLMYLSNNAKNGMCIGGDLEMIVGAISYKPNDTSGGICYYQLTALLQQIQLKVGQEVAHQSATLHTVRRETIPFCYSTNG